MGGKVSSENSKFQHKLRKLAYRDQIKQNTPKLSTSTCPTDQANEEIDIADGHLNEQNISKDQKKLKLIKANSVNISIISTRSGLGKTCLLRTFMDQKVPQKNQQFESTIGIDTEKKSKYLVNQQQFNIVISEYQAIEQDKMCWKNQLYCSDCVLFLFDEDDLLPKNCQSLVNRVKNLKQSLNSQKEIYLVANDKLNMKFTGLDSAIKQNFQQGNDVPDYRLVVLSFNSLYEVNSLFNSAISGVVAKYNIC